MVAAVGGGGLWISSILRTAGARGGGDKLPLELVRGEDLDGISSRISSMLRTGSRGLLEGDGAAPAPVELAGLLPVFRGVVFPSNSARTSFRSSSNTDSSDMFFAMVAAADYPVFAVSPWRLLLLCCCALSKPGQ